MVSGNCSNRKECCGNGNKFCGRVWLSLLNYSNLKAHLKKHHPSAEKNMRQLVLSQLSCAHEWDSKTPSREDEHRNETQIVRGRGKETYPPPFFIPFIVALSGLPVLLFCF
jgi:hypothetical protein